MTKEQIELTEKEIGKVMTKVISDNGDRSQFVTNVIDDVVEDIDCNADWGDVEHDEICLDDIHIALARVLLNLSGLGK